MRWGVDPPNAPENRIRDGARRLSEGSGRAFLAEPLSWVPLFLPVCALMMWRWPEGSQRAGLLYNPIIGCNPCMTYLEICLPINSYLKDNHISIYEPLGQVLPSHF